MVNAKFEKVTAKNSNRSGAAGAGEEEAIGSEASNRPLPSWDELWEGTSPECRFPREDAGGVEEEWRALRGGARGVTMEMKFGW